MAGNQLSAGARANAAARGSLAAMAAAVDGNLTFTASLACAAASGQ